MAKASNLKAGQYHKLKVARIISIGAYLDDGADGLLLPNRFLPPDAKVGDTLNVFVYHDSEDRLIATTQQPYAQVNEFAYLKVVSSSQQGAFVDWGLTKDLFVPRSQQREPMRVGHSYLVYLYQDEKTGRIAATEWYDKLLEKDASGLETHAPVELIVYRSSPLGYSVIINNKFEGLIHHADAVVPLKTGQRLQGFIKHVSETGKADVVPGVKGYAKTGGHAQEILELLQQHQGALPYTDKSDPEDIYAFFGMSKKAFKTAIGNLYRQKLIELLPGGIKLVENTKSK